MTAVSISQPALAAELTPRPVRGLVLLGDSTSVGIGDPLPGGGWRGFGPILLDSLGARDAVRYANLSFPGARMADVRQRQLPTALRHPADVAVLIVGMNDTLRSDFDPVELGADYDTVVSSLRAAGTTVLTVRFHDHSKVFWLPGPLRRALHERIGQLNTMTDTVVRAHGIGCLDLHVLPGGYDRATWSVDRLHPSELGHRLLAEGFARLLVEAGFAVPRPVELTLGGGRKVTPVHHLLWLLFKGLPWLWRRSGDLLPHAASLILREFRH
ncbi:SGNH/GDSL hydrolase family protein [Pseudonocardia spinosispora]|uniref:SGNH/GDSL hydrolase family protein n=1 Tax=Pseudonocardia spinosispora TaxID=103441 RepID=UPI0004126C00|nr:SGNH/GDSL hydrolase family protein [Pseudonocardia spinosispora]